MNELTDGQIDEIQFPAIDYATAHVIRTHRRAFARAVIAALPKEYIDTKPPEQDMRTQIIEACAMVAEDGFKYALDAYQIADKIRELK